MEHKGIVNIQNSNGVSVGTGFFVSANGFLLTCYHVLQEMGDVTIGRQVAFKLVALEGRHFASVCAIDVENDIAILRSDKEALAVYYTFQRQGSCGEKLSTLGFPNGDSIGIPANPVLQEYIENGKYIQLENSNIITYGFSGAPLVTGMGTVVGMVAWIPQDSNFRMQEIAHAIPAQTIIDVFPEYIEIANETKSTEEILTIDGKLPHVLTKSGVVHVDEQCIIHREEELSTIESLLKKGQKTILLGGFGGLGKTSLARILYSRLSNNYSSIGWIEYRGNLKKSILGSMELYENVKDQGKRWEMLSKCLKNNLSQKLLFIDNVDRDANQEQNPLEDHLLQDISGWPNMTIVITSRLDEICGYKSYRIGCLGDDVNRKEWCLDLFYFYYSKEEYNKSLQDRSEVDVVYELVELAGYHTYAIELLAKSAKYEASLECYLAAVRKSGFKFPQLNIFTNHKEAYANAAEQLRRLFDMKTRTDLEKRILWDFAILPNISLSIDEVNDWLEFTVNDLDQLIAESWLLYQKGFYMHPLIKEVILLDLKNGKAPHGTASKLIRYLYNNSKSHFISGREVYTTTIRKLDIAENIIKYVPIQKQAVSAKIYYNVGYCFFARVRRRKTSIKYLEKALQIYQNLEITRPQRYIEEIAQVSYRLGYIKSATSGHRKESVNLLREALTIRREQEKENPGKYITKVAQVCDHLGYVLSDIPAQRKEAEELLQEALDIRIKLVGKNSLDYEANVATTCDNLGWLLAKDDNQSAKAEQLLKEALTIRRKLANITPERHLTEVAWTCHNLGELLSKDNNRRAEAEQFYREALKIRNQMEEKSPGLYTGNVAWTTASLAKLLYMDGNRTTEVIELCREVLELRQKLDSDHLGFFIDDIAKECQDLLNKITDDRD